MSFPPIPSLPLSPSEIESYLRRFKEWKFKWDWNHAIQAQVRAKRDPRTYIFLRDLYRDYAFFSVNGNLFPVVLLRAPEEQIDQPESVLTRPLGVSPSFNALAKKGQEHLDRLRHLAQIKVKDIRGREKPLIRLWEGRTYGMLQTRVQGSLSMQCYAGWYYDMIKTCDSLQWELLTTLGSDPSLMDEAVQNPQEFMQESLGLRALAHRGAGMDPILNGKGRSNAIGVSCSIVFQTERGWATIVRERSPYVAVCRDALHVVPSFMFASEVGDLEREYSVRHNICREYLEEVFNKHEIEQPPPAATFNWFYSKYPDYQYLRDMLESGKAKLLFTGLAVDVFTLRTEILTLLLVNSSEWWANHSQGNEALRLSHIEVNDEFKSQQILWEEQRDIIVRVDLDDDLRPIGKSLPSGLRLDDPAFWVPSGAAAFYHGLEVARRRI
jgi:hypothetical protein